MSGVTNMYEVTTSKRFDKKLMTLSPKDTEKLAEIVELMKIGKPLPENLRDHQLKGDMKDSRELHIRGDLLLVYTKNKKLKIIHLDNITNHNKLSKRGSEIDRSQLDFKFSWN